MFLSKSSVFFVWCRLVLPFLVLGPWSLNWLFTKGKGEKKEKKKKKGEGGPKRFWFFFNGHGFEIPLRPLASLGFSFGCFVFGWPGWACLGLVLACPGLFGGLGSPVLGLRLVWVPLARVRPGQVLGLANLAWLGLAWSAEVPDLAQIKSVKFCRQNLAFQLSTFFL